MREPTDIFNQLMAVADHAPKLPEKYAILLNTLGEAFDKAQTHARECHLCFHPIIDEEGNPQYMSEACAEGAVILQAYINAENALLNAPSED